VAQRDGTDGGDRPAACRAVFLVLRQAIGDDEFAAQLPRE